MVRKKTEGNEEQKRQKARAAKARGNLPSAEGTTTGASKQRLDMQGGSHRERIEAKDRGKQGAAAKPSKSLATGHGRNEDTEADRG